MDYTTTRSPIILHRDSSSGKRSALDEAANELEQGYSRHLSKRAHLSVKEAAQRLNISPSRIYRMDRSSGAFPIVKIGWRVFIDLPGLDLFVARSRSQLGHIDSESQELPGSDEVQNSAVTGDQNGIMAESGVSDGTMAAPVAVRPLTAPMALAQGSGNGQRDLLSGWV
jgi:hypothetical protein